ncbi:MAG: HlyD family efflux transporter periplasmic adaptor subunit [Hyphomicrobiaceae bacterium]
MDTRELEAQIREAQAGTAQAEQQHAQAESLIAQRKIELALAELELKRALTLVDKGVTPKEQLDQRRSARDTAAAALNSANAQAALAKASIAAASARVDTLKASLLDSVLVAPRAGRIQYRLALGGEVLPAGGKVVTLLDLSSVYMTIYLPTVDAGRLAIGSEARIVLDAAPQYVVPATVSFVAADAQFTPKFVETRNEREKLMFRVKLQIPQDTLKRYAALVKTGIPGLAYVKVARSAQWPEKLAVRLPK